MLSRCEDNDKSKFEIQSAAVLNGIAKAFGDGKSNGYSGVDPDDLISVGGKSGERDGNKEK